MIEHRLLAEYRQPDGSTPFITIAIPHYRHRQYLEIVLDSLFKQTYLNFDILISSDNSPDDSDSVLPPVLYASGRPFTYYAQMKNLGYDGNVRFCLSVARGRYVFLLGNDDAIANNEALEQVAASLQILQYPAVAFTNYQDYGSNVLVQRALVTADLGSGADVVLRFYPSFSFVSGLIFSRASAIEHETDRWDRSVYYQIYLACRIIAQGGVLGSIAVTAVRKDVLVEGQGVPNYITRVSTSEKNFHKRHTGVDSAVRVTWDAIQPSIPVNKRSTWLRRLFTRVYLTWHPYWILEYRRIANWEAGVGVARGHYPGLMLQEYALKPYDRLVLWIVYLMSTTVALLTPVSIFNALKSRIALILRRSSQSRVQA